MNADLNPDFFNLWAGKTPPTDWRDDAPAFAPAQALWGRLTAWLLEARWAVAETEPQAWPSLSNYPYGPAPQ
jgi:hypothetical protein